MATNNLHIRQFLSYYCKLNNSPEYAVLIKGPWGTGKTWFIKNCLDEFQKEGQDHLYVSLYGMTSPDDIESEFFRQLHPLLASKGVKLLGKLAKGLIKATVKLDIDGDNQPDGSLTIGVPNEKFIEAIKTSENNILVFDDVERCGIPICHLLGYINKFVEHCGSKVVLIANEKEIVEREKESKVNSDAYQRVKEKLVGKTFEIVPEIAPALSNFVITLQCDKAKTAIDENKELVTQLYYDSSYKNLRILRYALWEFDRLVAQLPDEVLNNKPFITHFLTIYLIFSFEIMSGVINPNEILMFRKSLYSSIGGRQEQPNPYQKYLDIKAKYKGIDLHDALFHESVWESIFDEGFIASAEINEAIKNCKYFQSENQPNWVRLWHGRDLSDSDFKMVLETVDSEWKSMVFTEIGIVKHVAGILFWLSEIGLYHKSKKQILAFSKRYVDKLKKQGHLLSNRTNRVFALANSSWGGLGFHNNDDDMFKVLLEYISRKEKETIIESYPSEATLLLNSMKNDTDQFYRYLVLCNHADNKYYETPILAYITPSEFVNIYLELTPNQRTTVAYAFEERYKASPFNQKLVSEISFLRKVISLLNKAKSSRKGKISSYTIGLFVDYYLKKGVAILESLQTGGPTDQTTTSG